MKVRLVASIKSKSRLRRKILHHLKKLGFVNLSDGTLGLPSAEKDIIRTLHSEQRKQRIKENNAFLKERANGLFRYFASGCDVIPEAISPVLQRVYSDTWESDLFRLAALSWSVPVSNGFGRRLRYLVWDQSNGKLIGLLAIGDPVFNLSVRDNYIGWNAKDRGKRLVNILDAYVLGALPPYNTLLCGKLIACLLRTKELYSDFRAEYGRSTGIISGEEKGARLLAITTSSSMGRSSVYNRLKLDGRGYLTSLGFTRGWGHFHIPDDIFADMRSFLREIKHPYADLHKFGDGPNWRMRTSRAALDALGFNEDMLKHGIGREVFICELASNASKILKTGKGRPDTSTLLTVEEVANLALERWVIPRSNTRLDYQVWDSVNVKQLIINSSKILTQQEHSASSRNGFGK